LKRLNMTQAMLYRLRHEVRTAIRGCEDDLGD